MNSFPPIPGTLVIGFGHRARSGKDTAAATLVQAFPGLVQRFAFADALRAVARVEHGMTVKDGALLQRLGVAWRERDEDVWVRACYWAMVEAAPRVAVITDVRFPNEAQLVRAVGGVTCRTARFFADGAQYWAPDGRDPNHISEVALESPAWWDYQIVNPDGDLEVFRWRVLHWFRLLCARVGLALPDAVRESRIGEAVV